MGKSHSKQKDFGVWYRHSGEKEIDEFTGDYDLKVVKHYGNIVKSIDSHHITHMSIEPREDGEMPPLDIMAPQLTHLKLSRISEIHNLDCVKSLQRLQVLHIQEGDFSNRFPDVISQLGSLRELKLKSCRLSDLPQSVKSLQSLQVLHIEESDFSKGYPDVISQLGSLRVLKLKSCRLTDLPQRLSNLHKLVTIDLQYNGFRGRLPSVIYQLLNLQSLDIRHNALIEIESDILNLSKLEVMECNDCSSLVSPPYAVCEQGLPAIKQYFMDLQYVGIEVNVVIVAVVGNLMSGKTSLIRSLQSGIRELTFRQMASPLDEATKVFNMENLTLTDTSTVKFAEITSQMAYQFVLTNRFIPLIVVNLEEYHTLSSERGPREATRRLCFDWLSHLYSAHPDLHSPMLALTHRDKLTDEEFELCRSQLLTSTEYLRGEFLAEITQLSEGGRESIQIRHFSDTKRPPFDPEEIFVFDDQAGGNSSLESLKSCIEKHVCEYQLTIPKLWESVSLYLDEKRDKPYVLISDIEHEFPDTDQLEVILRYLHNTGAILWLESIHNLSDYILFRSYKLVNMIAVVFHATHGEIWDERQTNLIPFKYNDRLISQALYRDLVAEFQVTGIIDEAILGNWLQTEAEFPKEIALQILKAFNIIHGPIVRNSNNKYIIPYSELKYMDRKWRSDGYLQLRADIVFEGLALPEHAYQQMTVATLRSLSESSQTVKVYANGVTIRHGERAAHLMHDHNNKTVMLQISTPAELIGRSWQHLIELIHTLIDSTKNVWKASQPKVVFYCSHCLFKRINQPDCHIDPSWFLPDNKPSHMTHFTGMEAVYCANSASETLRKLTVPKPLRFPCFQLTESEIASLKEYLSQLEQNRPPTLIDTGYEDKVLTNTLTASDDDDLDIAISDIEEHEDYWDFTNPSLEHYVSNLTELKPTRKRRIQELFHNTSKVYPMTGPVRGRVMIINNRHFYDENGKLRKDWTRDGSNVDYDNIRRLFEDMNFDIVKEDEPMFDLSGQEISSEIKQETMRSEHHSYGMFVLVIMSYGIRGDFFYDRDGQLVDLISIESMLSPRLFPAMAGKPKVIIFLPGKYHDTSGEVDLHGHISAAEVTINENEPPVPEVESVSSDFTKVHPDDFLVVKANLSCRSQSNGSLFIRILVATFYEHSCHRDIEKLFKIIQDRIRRAPHHLAAEFRNAVPSSSCTFTNFRKLYLFPEYPGLRVWYRHSGQKEIDGLPEDCIHTAVHNYREITESIGAHHITHMSIDPGHGEELPLDIIAPHLTHLRLIRIFPRHNLDCLESLQQLQVLHIKHSEFPGEWPHSISQLSSLRELHLLRCKFSDLPESMKNLENLQILNFKYSDFSKGLPDVISQMSTLIELRLESCQLTNLPERMEALIHLQVLHIVRNDFSNGVPVVISQLKELKELKLEHCQITDLPLSLKRLQQLEVLHLDNNDFKGGLPDAISQMEPLQELNLKWCHLADLPQRLSDKLQHIDLQHNNFRGKLPAVIYQLPNLLTLDISHNSLKEIESNMLELTNLKVMECDGCNSLEFPPYNVCKEGVLSVMKYFEDFLDKAGIEATVVPVAVVGNLKAGKTSLIRSLISGERELTIREDDSPLDETTEVFKIEKMSLMGSEVSLIDFGGHEVYHMAYQLALKEKCIPLIVVNLKEYRQLSCDRGPREATGRLCFDWLAHLYLACPRLGPPMLALTHRDKLLEEQFELHREELISSAEIIREELLKEEQALSEGVSDFCKILHISDTKKPLFAEDDIFVFSDESHMSSNIDSLKMRLEKRCSELSERIPRHWELVNSYLEQQKSKHYLKLSEIKEAFPDDQQIELILKHLHNTGKILWFQNEHSLSDCIFHHINKIVEMIAMIFHHSGNKGWDRRVKNAIGFKYKGRSIGRALYGQLVKQFQANGIMDEAILANLLDCEAKFPQDVASELLRTFYIIHGPIDHNSTSSYIIPYFSPKYMDRKWKTDGYLQLRADIVFNGLPLPRYVYHLITVAVLGFRPDLTKLVRVYANGATIHHDSSVLYVVHDYSKSTVTLQISTPLERIDSSWKQLIELEKDVVEKTVTVWKAAHPEIVFYCAHCLFKEDADPAYVVDPSWSKSSNQLSGVAAFSGVECVHCENSESDGKLTVLKPLRFPCYSLSDEEKSKLRDYLTTLEKCSTSSTTDDAEDLPSPPDTDTLNKDDDSESVCSDIEETGYADFTNLSLEPHIRNLTTLVPTRNERVKQLFDNQKKAYEMSEPVRGRAMIINNQYFDKRGRMVPKYTRTGSEWDYDNIRGLFEDMGFVTVQEEEEMLDYSKEKIISEIKKETRLPVHRGYGMFVLVIMSHGSSDNIFYDSDCEPVKLTDVKNLLNATNFPAMKGKPKLIILQACSGERLDLGDSVDPQDQSSSMISAVAETSPTTTEGAAAPAAAPSATTPAVRTAPGSETPAISTTKPPQVKVKRSKMVHLDADDFYVTKPSTESYNAGRHPHKGTWFIRILVATFYKHSCHRDIEELFRIIQERVRQASIAYCNKIVDSKAEESVTEESTKESSSGNVPSASCTFTHRKKLFFFPKYSGK